VERDFRHCVRRAALRHAVQHLDACDDTIKGKTGDIQSWIDARAYRRRTMAVRRIWLAILQLAAVPFVG